MAHFRWMTLAALMLSGNSYAQLAPPPPVYKNLPNPKSDTCYTYIKPRLKNIQALGKRTVSDFHYPAGAPVWNEFVLLVDQVYLSGNASVVADSINRGPQIWREGSKSYVRGPILYDEKTKFIYHMVMEYSSSGRAVMALLNVMVNRDGRVYNCGYAALNQKR